jgi:hypothetical protein
MKKEIAEYNRKQDTESKAICQLLEKEISHALPKAESKVWHRSPVWFLDGNPVAGYSVLKGGVQLLFWSGQSFEEPGLMKEGNFKAAQAMYTAKDEVKLGHLRRWLRKAKAIQWDYKNIVKNKGKLARVK